MSVHKEISQHVESQRHRINQFHELEATRELFIDEAVSLCQQNKSFSVDKINSVTKQINELAKQGAVPTRKLVTEEMVKEYVEKLKKKD